MCGNGNLSPHIFLTAVSVPEASVFGMWPESLPMDMVFNIHDVFGCITSDTMTKPITDCVAVDLDDRPSSLVDCLAMDGSDFGSVEVLAVPGKRG
jgi:hypothetical protein